jgi:hypothetical protein
MAQMQKYYRGKAVSVKSINYQGVHLLYGYALEIVQLNVPCHNPLHDSEKG